MARPRKNATPPAASLAERLRSALVPEEEQPYPVPANWCWVRLTKGFAECLDAYRKPVNAAERAKRTGSIPYYGATGQVGWIDDYLTDEELVLLGEDGAPFLDILKDKAYIIHGKAWVNNHAHILRSYYSTTGNKFLLHYLNQFDFTEYVNGTTRMKLTQGSMDTIPIPLPPLAEQQRIVERIEALFAKLDEARAKLEEIRDGHETRRAAILHKAFTGELTRQWREEHGVGLESWEERTLGEVCEINPSRNNDIMLQGAAKVSFVPMNAVSEVTGSIRTYQMRNYNDVKSGYTCFCEGDVLFAKITPCMENGKSAIVGKLVNNIGFGSTEFYVLRCTIKIANTFLHHLIRSRMFRNQARGVMAGAVGQLRVPRGYLETYVINVPQLPEQQEIVRLLDSLLAREDRVHQAATQALKHIDLMKKAILARAFRGGLGTNVAGEANVLELSEE